MYVCMYVYVLCNDKINYTYILFTILLCVYYY